MPHNISSVPFATRLTHGAKNILARAQARAQKLLQGFNPNGPLVFQEARRQRELYRGRHHHEGEGLSTSATPANQGGSAASGGSIDVTDAGKSSA